MTALTEGMRAGEARLPEETEGTDPTGVARVQVGAQGMHVGISFNEGWQGALAEGTLGSAVVAAAQAASLARADAFRAAIETQCPSQDAFPPAPSWSPDPDASPTTDLGDLVERALTAATAIQSGAATVDVSAAIGTSRCGEVTVALTGDQLVDVTVDAQSARSLSTYGLTMVAQEALGRARAEAAARQRPARDPELDTLFGEAMAHPNQMIRQSEVHGGTGV